MQRREQLGVDGRARKSRLHRRSRARRLSGRDTDDQDGQVTRKDGDLGVAIETGKTQVQRDTRDYIWEARSSARG